MTAFNRPLNLSKHFNSPSCLSDGETLFPDDWCLSEEWHVFGPLDRNHAPLKKEDLKTLPKFLEMDDEKLICKKIIVENGQADLAPLLNGTGDGKTAYIYIPFEAKKAGRALLGVGADWWFEAFVDGEKVADTLACGNAFYPPSAQDHGTAINLTRGRHLLVIRFISGSISSALAVGTLAKDEYTYGYRYPTGKQTAWGIPFVMGEKGRPRVVLLSKEHSSVEVPVRDKAAYVCFIHEWKHAFSKIELESPPHEGQIVGEYRVRYSDGTEHLQAVRSRFEVGYNAPAWPTWLAMPYNMWESVDPSKPDSNWGLAQYGLRKGHLFPQSPFQVYAMPNPFPGKTIESISLQGMLESPLVILAITLYAGKSHPLRHLPRRSYRLSSNGKPVNLKSAEVDMGIVARIEETSGKRDDNWVKSAVLGPRRGDAEKLIEMSAAEDANLTVRLENQEKPVNLSVGEAYNKGITHAGGVSLEVLGKRRQWMQVRVIDVSTGKPTPVRVHFSGPHGEYLAPYGHHSQINANWFEDYGADVVVGDQNFAYVPGEFTTDMPVGEVYVEISKGFEYEPVRKKITVRPGQKKLELSVARWKNLRSQGWVTADTHVHFLSPQTAWLQAQGEGINVVNLLASQWGRLFTNVGDYIGRVGVVEDDTIVYVGTENRNHMLGHISMLGTKGLPVYPMCCGGPSESWIGEPDFKTLAEWAAENRRKGGVVIRPHFPICGNTEDPVPIIKGLIDALEIQHPSGNNYPTQEWYRYLNCGYRVATVGGTDKMSAAKALGSMRTYAKLDPDRPFAYDEWASAVRAGRTLATNGPLVNLSVDGHEMGDTIKMSAKGGAVEIRAIAESFWPLALLEIVCNGKAIASETSSLGERILKIKCRLPITGSVWIAARCSGHSSFDGNKVAHTSPVYINCGNARLFDAPAAQHFLSLVNGGIEYLNTLATVFDESSRKRMVKLFKEVQKELKGRLLVEGNGHWHQHNGSYHRH